jgi:diguanylate cyclase (GGDEF)-like protein
MSDCTAEPKRILVVEDEFIVAHDLRGVLEDLGYEVVGTAESSDEALQRASDEHPDLVLMDIRLSGRFDGIQTARRLRARHRIPVVYLTANTDPQTLSRALETAPGGYLAKPFNAPTLAATIEVALRQHQAELTQERAHEAETLRLQQEKRALKHLAEHFRRESTIDPLTGLHNRRHLEKVMKRELSLASREGHSLGLILLDLDHFKLFNDTYGHVAADEALRTIAAFLRSRLRAYDIACRYGGEEIVIVVPRAQLRDACALAEQLRRGIEQLAVDYEGTRLSRITASFGVSVFPKHGLEFEPLMQAADAALYDAKGSGRNRVSVPPIC